MGPHRSCVAGFGALVGFALAAAAQQDVTKLIDQLAAKSPAERVAAAEELAKLGPKAVDAAAALEKRLADKDAGVATAAGRALGSIGKPAFARIRAALVGRESSAAAIVAIGAAGADGAELLPDMLRMFAKGTSSDPASVPNAVEAVNEIAAPALPPLVAGMKLRGQAAYAAMILVQVKDKKLVSSIWSELVELAAKKAELDGTRGYAFHALSQLRALGADAVPGLLAIARDTKDSPYCRGQAIDALSWIAKEHDDVKAAVTKLQNDKEAEVAAKAKEALPRFK